VAVDDHDDHADRQDQDVAVLLNDVGDIQRLEQNAASPHLEQQHDGHQGNHHAGLADVRHQE
jgi:hypothetical protein